MVQATPITTPNPFGDAIDQSELSTTLSNLIDDHTQNILEQTISITELKADADISTNDYTRMLSGSIVGGFYRDEFNRTDSTTVGEGWTEHEGTGTISISSNAMVLHDNGGGAGYCRATHSLDGNPSQVVLRWKYTSTAVHPMLFALIDDDVEIIDVRFSGGGKLQYYDTAPRNVVDVVADTFYTIKIDIDYTNEQYDIYVDDVLEKENAPFKNSITAAIDSMFFSTSGSAVEQSITIDKIECIGIAGTNNYVDISSLAGTDYTAMQLVILNDDYTIEASATYNIVDASDTSDDTVDVNEKHIITTADGSDLDHIEIISTNTGIAYAIKLWE
jgi:hypothetical protein